MSEFSRETLLNIIETDHVQCGEASALARMALAADSEPVAVIDLANLDYLLSGADADVWPPEREEMGDVLLYRHAQPAPGYPEVLPCSVLLEPGLRFGKGIKTSTMLAALERRAVYESDLAALSPEEMAEFQTGIEDFKALIAHPVPVVPQDVLEALQKVARIRLDLDEFDGDRRGIADCLCDAEEALIEVVNRRAAMLAAAPQSPGSEHATMPGKWIPVSEQKPDCWCLTCRPVVLNDMRFVVCPDCGNKRCPRANDHRNACTGSNEPGQEGSAYPDTPREVK
ncbi:TPA: hypothetical protein ACHJC8_003365 [Klebsiella pneumoniae]|nr:hypothetical protein [Klebsiella pneumoniae]